MATRGTIKVEGQNQVKIYKHWDSSPEDTLPWLEEFNKDFTKNRGIDPEYKFAQVLRSSARAAKEYELDDSKYTGWGVVPYDSDCGEDYEYTLHDDGTVSYKEV